MSTEEKTLLRCRACGCLVGVPAMGSQSPRGKRAVSPGLLLCRRRFSCEQGTRRGCAGQRVQQGEPERPIAMTGFDIDMPCVPQPDEFATPGTGISTGEPYWAIRVVGAADDDAGVRQPA